MLYQILYVGFGSLVGGILRFLSFTYLPFGILGNLFFINFAGSFCAGFFSHLFIAQEARLIFIVGFLGSFTTFSTFTYELFSLFSLGKLFHALGYLFLSTILGIFGVWCGISLAKFV